MPSCEELLEEAQAALREFGVEEPPGRLVVRGDSVWLTAAPDWPSDVRVHSVGVRLFRSQKHGLKPTSFGLMLLGPRITKRRVEVNAEELEQLLLGRSLPKSGLPEGYVALCLGGEVLGCGEARGGKLRCQIPRARRQELLVVLAHEPKIERAKTEQKGGSMETVEDILKGAILLEEHGRAFYAHAAQEAKSPGVREIFEILAKEEERHKEYLAKALGEYLRTRQFSGLSSFPVDVTAAVLTEDVKREIEAASFEASAIYAGMALEEKAVAFYTEKAKAAPPELAPLYQRLAKWEQTHLDLLAALDEDLRQRVWHERSFWPSL